MRAWSRQLGFSTPSYLSDVLNGQRKLKPQLASRIAKQLVMSPRESARLDLLALRDSAKTDAEKLLYSELLAKMGGRPQWIRLQLDQFKVIADWYHLPILEMTRLKNFDPSPVALAARLGGKVSPRLLAQALARLISLGLLRRRPDETLERTDGDPCVGDTSPSEAIREHHRQYLKKAEETLKENNIEERDFRGSTVAIRRGDMDRARDAIRRCHKELRDLECAVDADDVYRFSSQFFRLTHEVSDHERP